MDCEYVAYKVPERVEAGPRSIVVLASENARRNLVCCTRTQICSEIQATALRP